MTDDSISQILAQHDKFREQSSAFDILTAELAQMDLAHSAGDWVEGEMGKGKEALLQLKKLLDELEEGLKAHWQFEDKDLIPFLVDNGQRHFADNLLAEHKEMGLRLRQHRSTSEKLLLVHGKAGERQHDAGVKSLRRSLKDFFEMQERHAIREEEMVFQIGHGV